MFMFLRCFLKFFNVNKLGYFSFKKTPPDNGTLENLFSNQPFLVGDFNPSEKY